MYKVIGSLDLREKVTEFFFEIWLGGPQSQGVVKFQKLSRRIDRGSQGLFYVEKILALRRTELDIDEIKI